MMKIKIKNKKRNILSGASLMALVFMFAVLVVTPSYAFAADRYVAPGGQDIATNGTASSPWKTFTYAVSRLSAGDILHVGAGTYYERNIIDINKTNIQIVGESGALIDASYPELQQPNTSQWEVWDAAKGIYRSKSRYAGAGYVAGSFMFQGKEYRLVTYADLNYDFPRARYDFLASDNEYESVSGPVYVGPGVFFDESGVVDSANPERIYMRMKKSKYMTSEFSSLPSDPNQLVIYLSSWKSNMYLRGSSGVVIKDIKFRNGLRIVEKSHDVSLSNVVFYQAAGRAGWGFMMNDGSDQYNITLDNVRFEGSNAPWVTWRDVKVWTQPAYNLEALSVMLNNGAHHVIIKNSVFNKGFDGVYAIGNVHHLEIANSKLLGIRDDAITLGSSVYEVEIHHNVMRGPGTAVSRQGSGNSARPGTKYMHHNIVDMTESQRFLRAKSGGDYDTDTWATGPYKNGVGWLGTFGNHGISSTGSDGDPRMIYNNTIVGGYHGDSGVQYGYEVPIRNTAIPQRVYNNVFVQAMEGPIQGAGLVTDGSFRSDGNAFFRMDAAATKALFIGSSSWYSLSAMQSATGLDKASVYADPQLNASYIPGNTAAISGGVDIKALAPTLPGVDGIYRGAFRPGGAPSVDTTPPSISSIATSSITQTGTTITWTTNEASDSQVEYGLTTSYGSQTTFNTAMVTNHGAALSGLSTNTLYHYRVKSKDAAGNLATSSDATFNTLALPDIASPTISLSAPANGTAVSGTISITASATDNIGVAGVQFKLDGVNLGVEDTASPYSASWNTAIATNGTHTLTAVARDAAGNTTTATGISVTVSNTVSDTTLPSVSINSPTSGTTYTSSQNVTITASASDNVGVTKVEFYDGTTLKGTDTASPYSFSLAITSADNGTHTWTAKAYDAVGNAKVSLAVNLTVNIGASSAPIAHWKFDETSGTNASDSSGNGITGTLINGPVWTTGKIGGALQFDGVNDMVNLGNPTLLNFGTNSFTYSLWVKVPSSTGAYDMPLSKGGSSATTQGYDMELGTGSWGVSLSDGTRTAGASFGSETLNAWTLLTAVVDRGANTVSSYKNGTLVNTNSLVGFGSVSSSFNANLGIAFNGTNYPFKGLLDDIRIYNRTLSATEVNNLYAAAGATVPLSDTTPPVISNITASGSATTTTVAWTTNESSDSKALYGTSSPPLNQVASSNLSASHSLLLNNLTRKTTYYYQAVSKDAAGNTASSTIGSFKTGNGKPSTVTNLQASEGSVILTWAVPQDDFITKVVIYRSTTGYPDAMNSSDLLVTVTDLTQTTYRDTSVSYGIAYYYSIFAVDNDGIVSDPAHISFTPKSPAPISPTPTPLTITPSITTNTISPVASSPASSSSSSSESSSQKKKETKVTGKIAYKPGERTAPYITLTNPKVGTLIAKKSLFIQVRATDKSGIQAIKVTVNGTLKKRANTSSISYTAKKIKGSVTINVTAYDTLGNAKTAAITIKGGKVVGVRYY